MLEETLTPVGQPTSVLPAPCASDQIDQASCSREVTRRCCAGAYTRKAFKHSVCCERRLRISHAMLRAREQANSRSQIRVALRGWRLPSGLLFLGRPPQPRALDKTHKKGAKELGTDSGERGAPDVELASEAVQRTPLSMSQIRRQFLIRRSLTHRPRVPQGPPFATRARNLGSDAIASEQSARARKNLSHRKEKLTPSLDQQRPCKSSRLRQ